MSSVTTPSGNAAVGRKKPYLGDFHKTKMFRRSEKPYFAIEVTALSYFKNKTYHHVRDEEPDLLNMIWKHFILKLRFYLGNMFFLVIYTRVHACSRKKAVCWKKAVSYDNCPHFGAEESRASSFRFFYMPDKKPYVVFSLICPPGKRP